LVEDEKGYANETMSNAGVAVAEYCCVVDEIETDDGFCKRVHNEGAFYMDWHGHNCSQ
jgi:hypothetical protein